MSKPSVTMRRAHATPNERIVEFSSRSGGGFVAFRETEGGGIEVEVYSCDAPVQIITPLSVAVRACVAAVREHNNGLDDPIGDGSGRGATAPTGDDYNEILAQLNILAEMAGIEGV